MKIYEGKKLKPKEHIRDWDDSMAEVVSFGKIKNKWYILIDGNFGSWYNEKEIEDDFEED